MLYKGELAYDFDVRFSKPAFNVIIRHNFSPAVVLRITGAYGTLKGDSRYSQDLYFSKQNPVYTFQSTVVEGQIGLEYNFIDYRKYKSHQLGTPYLFGSLGVFNASSSSTDGQSSAGMQMCIPFGVGYKRVLTRNWNISAEFGARKTFTGYLDGVHDRSSDPGSAQNGYKYNNDWYSYTCVMLSYTFYKISCPYEIEQ